MAHEDALSQGHGSADDEYLPTPPGSTYEHTDANVWIIVKFLMWLAVSAVVIHVGLGMLYQLMIERWEERGEARYPLAAAQEERLPPAPRLQQFPQNEISQFRTEERNLLERYGWMNKAAGIAHIPVDQAMRLTVERGLLTTRPPEAEQPLSAPGMMPSDASAGRTLERRRQ